MYSLIRYIQTVTNSTEPVYEGLALLQVALVWVQSLNCSLSILTHLFESADEWNFRFVAYVGLSDAFQELTVVGLIDNKRGTHTGKLVKLSK